MYGGIKPPANSTYFIGLAGFQETNAWIERNVSASNARAKVPILGNGVVVTYKPDSGGTYEITNAGSISLSIAVGGSTAFEGERGQALSMQSKVVYHWGGIAT